MEGDARKVENTGVDLARATVWLQSTTAAHCRCVIGGMKMLIIEEKREERREKRGEKRISQEPPKNSLRMVLLLTSAVEYLLEGLGVPGMIESIRASIITIIIIIIISSLFPFPSPSPPHTYRFTGTLLVLHARQSLVSILPVLHVLCRTDIASLAPGTPIIATLPSIFFILSPTAYIFACSFHT